VSTLNLSSAERVCLLFWKQLFKLLLLLMLSLLLLSTLLSLVLLLSLV
jgi:hypothetical protein